jgi:hypothetical protein
MASSNVIRDLGVGLAVTALVLVIVVMVPVIMNIQDIRDNKKRIKNIEQVLPKYMCNPSTDGSNSNSCVMDPNGTLSYGDCVVSQANNCGMQYDCDAKNGGCDYSKPSTTGKNKLSDCQLGTVCPKPTK